MYGETIEKFNESAQNKINFLKSGVSKYFVSSMLAGIYIGLGIILIFSVGAPLKDLANPFLKALMGASFGLALVLVIFAGSELFTGNNMVMTIGLLSKKVTLTDLLLVWLLSFVGNLTGSLLLAFAIAKSGLLIKPPFNEFILATSSIKMKAPFIELFIRAILCNMLVCLAVWTSTRAKDDSAKLTLIWWCLFAFIASGYEHSVANMTLLGTSLFLPDPNNQVTWSGFIYNLSTVSLGNIVGGGLIIGGGYWYISKKKGEKIK